MKNVLFFSLEHVRPAPLCSLACKSMVIHAAQNIPECFNVSPQRGGDDVLMKRRRTHTHARTHAAEQSLLLSANEHSVLCQTLLSKLTVRRVEESHTHTHTPLLHVGCHMREQHCC